eukprot:5404760-Amphidinium_carterae.1
MALKPLCLQPEVSDMGIILCTIWSQSLSETASAVVAFPLYHAQRPQQFHAEFDEQLPLQDAHTIPINQI